jgi:hypothetical protein
MRGAEVFPKLLHPQLLSAADSPKSDLFTTHHVSLKTMFTGLISNDSEGQQMTYVYRRKVIIAPTNLTSRPHEFCQVLALS